MKKDITLKLSQKKLYIFVETVACVAEKNVWITADFQSKFGIHAWRVKFSAYNTWNNIWIYLAS